MKRKSLGNTNSTCTSKLVSGVQNRRIMVHRTPSAFTRLPACRILARLDVTSLGEPRLTYSYSLGYEALALRRLHWRDEPM